MRLGIEKELDVTYVTRQGVFPWSKPHTQADRGQLSSARLALWGRQEQLYPCHTVPDFDHRDLDERLASPTKSTASQTRYPTMDEPRSSIVEFACDDR